VRGGPVFFSDLRLGLNKLPSRVHKFRSLATGADAILDGRLLTGAISARESLVTPFGRFLRETRLDELPQLWTILKGEMVLVGPRPIPLSEYEKCCKNVKRYDVRFEVRPGLVGFAQLLTPHNTPKRIRALVDRNHLIKRGNALSDSYVLAYAAGMLALNMARNLPALFRDTIWRENILHAYTEKRLLRRVRLRSGATVRLEWRDATGMSRSGTGQLADLNEEAFFMVTDADVPPGSCQIELQTAIEKGSPRTRRVKRIFASGQVSGQPAARPAVGGRGYVVRYIPRSPLNYYLVHQYLLHESIA